MKKLLTLLAAGLLALEANAGEAEWLTDLPKALEQARKENKAVLLDFTGSDWCGWCIKFKKDILTKDEFTDYARKNLVLVEVDFPRKKLPEAQSKANEQLKDKYDVSGFPTFVLVNAEGKELGKHIGYLEGGPKAFIGKLEEFKKKS